MLPLHQLLARFKNLPNTEKIKKEKIVEILKKNGFPSTIKQISFLKKEIQIKLPPIIKTEVLLKKDSILEQIKKELGKEEFLEIK